MSEETFERGETVRLKSGGPLMTYERVAQHGFGVCVWFEGDQHREKVFSHVSLVKDDGMPPLGGRG